MFMPVKSPKPSELGQRSNVILVDDDEFFCKLLSYKLSSQGFRVRYFTSATSMLNYLKDQTPPDIFILDYSLGSDQPSGLELCRKVKSYFQRPVVMLTGNDKVDTLVSCLNAGADQYIVKPCDIRELVARIDASLRSQKATLSRTDEVSEPQLVIDSDIKLNWESECLVHADGRQVPLTQKEIALLELFLKEESRSIDRNRAFLAMYGYEMEPMNRSIDLLVSRLRKKLQSLDELYQIKTLRGHGYAMFRK
jgi:DNA-binding response OmpR family regulator